MTDYYIVAVDDNGDVMAAPAVEVDRVGLSITIRTDYVADDGTDAWRERFSFENQGNDADSKGESARDALAAIMPEADDYGVCSECGTELPGDPENDVCPSCSENVEES